MRVGDWIIREIVSLQERKQKNQKKTNWDPFGWGKKKKKFQDIRYFHGPFFIKMCQLLPQSVLYYSDCHLYIMSVDWQIRGKEFDVNYKYNLISHREILVISCFN